VYNLSGHGVLPKEPINVSIIAQVNRPTTTTIAFKNPFLESVQAIVALETN